ADADPAADAGIGAALQPAGRHPAVRYVAELGYAISDLPVAVVGFIFVVVVLSVGVALAVTVIGLPVLAAGGLACRRVGAAERVRARALLGVEVGEPAPFRPRPGFLGWLRSALGDPTGWRAAVYLLATFPVGLATFVLAAVFSLAGPFLLL